MDEKILELLYRSFDRNLKPDEREKLDAALENSEELQTHKEEILKMRASLKQNRTESFGYMFADKVMKKIKRIEEKSKDELFFDSIISIFRPLVIAATFLLVFLISYSVISDNSGLFNDSQDVHDITLAEVFDPFNEFSVE